MMEHPSSPGNPNRRRSLAPITSGASYGRRNAAIRILSHFPRAMGQKPIAGRDTKAIDDFYVWLDRLVKEGKMKTGQRLGRAGKVVSRHSVTDGPFTESKEVIGGYWFILARSLDEAAKLAAGNPCLACGLSYEIRPIEWERASAFKETNETPRD